MKIKPIFNIQDYENENYVMRCNTQEEATIFCNYLHSIGKKWCNGDSYLKETHWNNYMGHICYNFNAGEFGMVVGYCRTFHILNFSQFNWSNPIDGIKNIYFNEKKKTTTIKWDDSSVTTVKCGEGDIYDKEKGIALCYMKKINGNTGKYNNIFKKYIN